MSCIHNFFFQYWTKLLFFHAAMQICTVIEKRHNKKENSSINPFIALNAFTKNSDVKQKRATETISEFYHHFKFFSWSQVVVSKLVSRKFFWEIVDGGKIRRMEINHSTSLEKNISLNQVTLWIIRQKVVYTEFYFKNAMVREKLILHRVIKWKIYLR